MNWTMFFSVLGGMACVFAFAFGGASACMWLERKIGLYPALGCAILVISLAGATYAGLVE